MTITLIEPDLMTYHINRYWPEIDMEWFVMPAITANDDCFQFNGFGDGK